MPEPSMLRRHRIPGDLTPNDPHGVELPHRTGREEALDPRISENALGRVPLA
jgi:hypothetical protein